MDARQPTSICILTGWRCARRCHTRRQRAAGTTRHGVASRPAGRTNDLVQVVREATERFRDASVAEAEGYALLFGCVSGPDSGAMGLHYVNLPLVGDGELDPTRPEIVIYEPTPNGRLRLTGADYLVLADAWDAKHRGAAAAHGTAAAPVRGPEPLRAAGLLHAARLGVEGESQRHVRELAPEGVVRRVQRHALSGFVTVARSRLRPRLRSRRDTRRRREPRRRAYWRAGCGAKRSPWARATASQSSMRATKTRVRTTSSSFAAERLQRAFDLVDREVRLGGGIRAADRAIAVRRRRPRDVHVRAAPRRPGEAGDALPRRAAQAEHAAAGARLHRVRRRERLHVMAQIAGRRQERRLAVLVAAVAGNRVQRRERRLQLLAIRGRSARSEKTRRLSSMCSRSPGRAPMMTPATAGCSRM